MLRSFQGFFPWAFVSSGFKHTCSIYTIHDKIKQSFKFTCNYKVYVSIYTASAASGEGK